MCTLVILRRIGHDWPLLVAGNRDEMSERPWAPPGRHWPDRAEVVAGLDELAGGSWFGVNDDGVVAVVMNREGTLGPDAERRSRGELVLEALDHAEASDAAQALGDLDPAAYRGFNLFVGDPRAAFWLCHRGGDPDAGVEITDIEPGLHMLTARDLDDASDARIALHLPRFREADVPDPDAGDWMAWRQLLESRVYPREHGPKAAMTFARPDGFGTVCSHLVAIPRHPGFGRKPVFLFADGPPDRVEFEEVAV